MLKYLLHYLLFGMTMFAAADVAVGGGGDGGAGGGDAGGDAGGAHSSDVEDVGGTADSGRDVGTVGDDVDQPGLDDDTAGSRDQARPDAQEVDKETGDLKGLVSKRLLALKKEAPELTQIFQKYPKVQEQVEAAFRRDMAYRELYPTVAEARSMREQFPNGMADVEQLLTDVSEVEQLDQQFYQKDTQGNYSGHAAIVQNMFQDDRDAAVSLFRTLPKEWARLDPDSYNEVMGQVVGATLQRAELPEWITELRDAAADPANLPSIKASLDKMLRWASSFQKRRAEPSEDERRLQGQREQFRRETEERAKSDLTRSKQTFFAESQKQQKAIVRNHPSITAMLQSKNLTDLKKNEIIEKIQTKIRDFVKTTRGYKKLAGAYHAGNASEALKLEKAMWSYPWILNKFVRTVMAEETPNLVRQNRERTRGAAQLQRRPETRQTQQHREEHTAPYQVGKVWHKKDGSRFTTAEILRGLHLQSS